MGGEQDRYSVLLLADQQCTEPPAGFGVEALLRLIEYEQIAGADQSGGKQERL